MAQVISLHERAASSRVERVLRALERVRYYTSRQGGNGQRIRMILHTSQQIPLHLLKDVTFAIISKTPRGGTFVTAEITLEKAGDLLVLETAKTLRGQTLEGKPLPPPGEYLWYADAAEFFPLLNTHEFSKRAAR